MAYIIKIIEEKTYPYEMTSEQINTFESDIDAWEFFYDKAFCFYRGVRDFFEYWGENDTVLTHCCMDEGGVTYTTLCKWDGFNEHYKELVIDTSTNETWNSVNEYLELHPDINKDSLWRDDDNAYRLINNVFVDRFYKDSKGVERTHELMKKEREKRDKPSNNISTNIINNDNKDIIDDLPF